MRDHRYRQFDLIAGHTRQSRDQGRTVATFDWFPEVCAVLRAWLVQTASAITEWTDDWSLIAPDQTLKDRVSAVDALSPAWQARLTDAIPWHDASNSDNEAAWIWGCALAHASCHVSPFIVSQFLTRIQSVVLYDAFKHTVSVILRDNQSESLKHYVLSLPGTVRDSSGCRSYRAHPHLGKRHNEWWAFATFHDVWDPLIDQFFESDFPDAALLVTLRPLGDELFLRTLEETRNPAFIKDILSHIEIESDNDILSLVAAAPLTCRPLTDDGLRGWTQNVTAPLVLDAVIDHCLTIDHLIRMSPRAVDKEVESDTLYKIDFPRLWDQIIETVLRRPDGMVVSTAFLVHLLHRLEQVQLIDPAPALVRVVEVVSATFRRQNISTSTVLALHLSDQDTHVSTSLPQRQPAMHRSDVVLAAVLLTTMAEDEVRRLHALFRTCLKDRDKGLLVTLNPFLSPRHIYAAAIITPGEDPVEQWRCLWDGLGADRLRLLHATKTQDLTAGDGSIFLLNTGMAAIHTLMRHGEDAQRAAYTLWKVLFDRAMSIICHDNETWLRNKWHDVAADLFGCLAVLHANTASMGDSAKISDALRQISLDDELLVKCAGQSHLNRGLAVCARGGDTGGDTP